MASTPLTGHVFISYRQLEPDKQFAHKLAYDLQAAGHAVWIDVQGIEAGQTWNTEIQRALDNCYAYVVILTPDALQSQWVRNELLYALREKAGRIFPVLLLDVRLPPELIAIQYVDFRYNYHRALTELLEHLPVPPGPGAMPSVRQSIRLPEPPPKRPFPSLWMGGAAALILLALIIGIGTLMANGARGTPTPPASQAVAEATTPAPSDSPTSTSTTAPTPSPSTPLGSADNPIIFEFFAEATSSGQVLQDSRKIAERLSEITGLTIKPRVEIKLSQIVGAMCTRTAHMSTLTTLSYLWARERSCAVVTLVALRGDESSTYVSQVIAKAGTPDIAALRGKTFCRIDAESPSSWVMPKILMKVNGIEDPDTDFGTIKDLGDARAVVRGIYFDECDAGGTFSDARNDLTSTLSDVLSKVKFMAKTPEIPNDSIAFIPEVPVETRDKITAALIQMAGEEDSKALFQNMNNWTGLREADDSIYEPFVLFFSASEYAYEDFVE